MVLFLALVGCSALIVLFAALLSAAGVPIWITLLVCYPLFLFKYRSVAPRVAARLRR